MLRNNLIVQPVVRASTMAGVFLPPSAQDEFNVGGPKLYRVLGKGPGLVNRKGIRIPIECEVGDDIICHSYTKGGIDLEGGLKIITDDQILAVIPKEVA